MRSWLPKHSKIMKNHDFPYKNVYFFSTDFSEDWKSFLNGSERFISAILVSRVKIMIPPGTHLSGRISENRKMCTRTTPPGSHFGEYL